MTDQIVYNAIMTPDGTIIQSRHRHDYKTHVDSVSGETYMVDGGIDYIRRNINKVEATELSLYSHDPHTKIRENVSWGSYGKDGDKPFRYIKVMDMETDHINAVLQITRLVPWVKTIFENELEYRSKGK